MSTTTWIALAVAVIAVVGYLLVMRVFLRQSRAADRQIDHSKIRPVKDHEDE
jgi:low affinity Fe/Cu permease